MITEEQIFNTNKEINSRIPREWIQNAVTIKKKYETMCMIFQKALDDPNFPAEKKPEVKIQLDKISKIEEITDNLPIQRKIDNFIRREQNKAVKEGRLPTKSKLRKLQIEWQEQKKK